MDSRQRILAAWSGQAVDHVPLTFQCFGNEVPSRLRWRRSGREVARWYTLRLEHIHTLPVEWALEDDFARVRAWQSLGVDDLIDVSIPWGLDPAVTWRDSLLSPRDGSAYPLMVRDYSTPAGVLRHAVRRTGEEQGEGWVVQPEHVQLIEDFNIPRAERQAVSSPEDIDKVRYLYAPPGERERAWFSERGERIGSFVAATAVAVQAWSAFGMDAVVWLCGTEGAILLAMDHPRAFGELVEMVTATDLARTELAAAHPAVDMIVQRGWYSSTDFWSPALFDEFLLPAVRQLAEVAHRHGKKFCYTLTTGVEQIGPRLADAGVDVLYFVDPLLDRVSLEQIRDKLGGGLALVGGANSITLAAGDRRRIEAEVRRALETLGGGGGFILHPVDALFPDTPWDGVEAMIEAWERYR